MDNSILEAALIGYGLELQKLQEKIAAIRHELNGGGVANAATVTMMPARKRMMSAAAKKRIREAQKKRWAEFHAKQGKAPAPPTAPKKRRLSPARRAALVANLAKARAARAAKRAAA